MREHLENILEKLHPGFRVGEHTADLKTDLLLLLLILGLALVSYLLVRFLFTKPLIKFIQRTANKWDDILIENKVLSRVTLLVPFLIFFVGSSYLSLSGKYLEFLSSFFIIGLIYAITSGILDTINTLYDNKVKLARQRPIKAFIQIIKIILFIVLAVILISKFAGKSPIYIISGLGALSAVLLLIFQDSIKGFVAGIQMASNDLVRIGDWIEMPKYGADGTVLDISLTVVKVQNFDKTITTIPSYALVSDSFKNWRGMFEAGGRRIKRSVYVDMSSIDFCSPELLKELEKIEYIKSYLEDRSREIEDYNREHKVDVSSPVNGRRLTNIGIFRIYINEYLKRHPGVHKDMILMVRQLQPESKGLPLEIYCFTKDTAWTVYENVQSDIFDHILAVAGYFNLILFQEPAGPDIRSLSSKKD